MTEKATPTNLYGLQRRFSNRRPFLQNVSYAILLIAPLFTLAPGAMANEAPLQIFEGVNYQGTSSTVETHTIFSGGTIPNGLDKKISSLIWQSKRGVSMSCPCLSKCAASICKFGGY